MIGNAKMSKVSRENYCIRILCVLSIFLTCFQSIYAAKKTLFSPFKPLAEEPGVVLKKNGFTSIAIHFEETYGVERKTESVQGSIPISKGELFDLRNVRLVDHRGKPVKAQFKVMSRWWEFDDAFRKKSSYSIKWLWMSFQTDFNKKEKKVYRLEYGEKVNPYTYNGIKINRDDRGITIDTGRLKAQFNSRGVVEQIYQRNVREWDACLKQALEIFAEIEYKKLAADKTWIPLDQLDGEQRWKFKIEKDANESMLKWKKKNLNDKKWQTVNPLVCWENQGYPDHNGYGWYRTYFKAKAAWKKREVYLDFRDRKWWHRDRNYWIYLNGKLLGELNPKSKKIEGSFRFLIPSKEISVGKNSLVIRAYDAGDGVGGLVCQPIITSKYNPKTDGEIPDWSGYYSNLNDTKAEMKVLDAGPEQTTVYTKGWLRMKNQKATTQYRVFYTFYRLSDKMDVSYSFTTTHNPALYRYRSVGIKANLNAKGKMNGILGGDVKDRESFTEIPLKGDEAITVHQFHDGGERYPGYPDLKSDHPLKLKYKIQNSSSLLKTGEKHQGWLGLYGKDGGVSVTIGQFWEHYPSQLSLNAKTNTIIAHMWPDKSPSLDLRTWADKKTPAWEQLVHDTKTKKDRYISHLLKYCQSSKFIYKDGEVPEANSVGGGWTRRIQFKFSPFKPKGEALAKASYAFNGKIIPYVSNRYNCDTEALAYPLHPYDPENFPIFETGLQTTLSMPRKLTLEWLNIYGMFYHGAMRMMYHNPNRKRKFGEFKYEWKRRWMHHESGYSPSISLLLQYMRTGYRKHYDFAEILSRYSQDVSIYSYNKNPHKYGYASKHNQSIFISSNSPSHTNLEGVVLYSLLTNDPRTVMFLKEMTNKYLKETIQSAGFRGKPLDRNTDGAFYNRVVLWAASGDQNLKKWIDKGFDFYKRRYKEGYTSRRRVTYTQRRMRTAWYYLRSSKCLDYLGDPHPFFVEGKTEGLYVDYIDQLYWMSWLMRKYQMYSNKSLAKVDDALTFGKMNYGNSHHTPIYAYDYKFPWLVAFYKMKFPSVKINPVDYFKRVAPYFYLSMKSQKSFKTKKGSFFKPFEIRKSLNANPHKNINDRLLSSRLKNYHFGLYHTTNDQSPAFDPKLKKKEIGWDFGPQRETAPGWRSVETVQSYPFYRGFEVGNKFSGFPFGCTVKYAGIPFDLVDPETNRGKGYLRLKKGEKVKIPFGVKAKRLFFLGHVTTEIFDESSRVYYTVLYRDGRKDKVELKPVIHFDQHYNTASSAVETFTVTPIYRFYHKAGYLHLNVFELKVNPNKEIKSVEIESQQEGYCVMAISTEQEGIDSNPFDSIDINDMKPYNAGKNIDLKVSQGWHEVKLNFKNVNLQKETFFIEANGKMVSGGFFVRQELELNFPVHCPDGLLDVKIHISGLEKEINLFESMKIRPFDKPNWLSPRKAIHTYEKYGMRKLPGKTIWADRISVRGLIDYENRDLVTSDYCTIANKSFVTYVPPGKYKLTLLLFSGLKQDYQFKVNGVLNSVKLLKNYSKPIEDIVCHAVEKAIVEVEVKTDKKLEIEFLSSKADRKELINLYYINFIGLRGLKLSPI